jgi:hypothetical protein
LNTPSHLHRHLSSNSVTCEREIPSSALVLHQRYPGLPLSRLIDCCQDAIRTGTKTERSGFALLGSGVIVRGAKHSLDSPRCSQLIVAGKLVQLRAASNSGRGLDLPRVVYPHTKIVGSAEADAVIMRRLPRKVQADEATRYDPRSKGSKHPCAELQRSVLPGPGPSSAPQLFLHRRESIKSA